jgi:hypothetical protein
MKQEVEIHEAMSRLREDGESIGDIMLLYFPT